MNAALSAPLRRGRCLDVRRYDHKLDVFCFGMLVWEWFACELVHRELEATLPSTLEYPRVPKLAHGDLESPPPAPKPTGPRRASPLSPVRESARRPAAGGGANA